MLTKTKRHLHDWLIPHEGNNHHPQALQHKHLAAYSYGMLMIKVLLVGILFLSFPSIAQFSTITQNRLMELANQSRSVAGLPSLSVNETLTRAAELKLQDMLANNYFAHDSPAGVSPWEWFKQAGYTYTYAGENLAMNFTEAEDAHQAWLDSPTHRANILNINYDEIGVAVGVGELDGQQVTLTVQLFGKTFVPNAGSPVAGDGVAGAEAEPSAVSQPQIVPPPLVGSGQAEPVIVEPPALEVSEPVPPLAEPETPESRPRIALLQLAPEESIVPGSQLPDRSAEVQPTLSQAPSQPPTPVGSGQAEIGEGARQQVILEEAESTGFVSGFLRWLKRFYWAILIFVGLALLLKVVIHFRIQHRSVIAHGLLVLAVGIFLLLLQLHFLETISGPVLIN